MKRREHRTINLGRAAIAAVAIAWLAPSATFAGDWFPRTSALLAKKPAGASEAKPGEIASAMNWWAIPRPARVAAKKLAKSQDASVTRFVAIEQEDKVAYEIHASHHLGPFKKKDDFVLTGVTEPKETAEKRREDQTLRKRMERLREKGATVIKGKPETGRQSGPISNGSSAFPPK